MAVATAIRMAIVRALVPPTTATPPRAAAVAHHHRHQAGAAAEVAAVIPVEAIRAEDSPAVEEAASLAAPLAVEHSLAAVPAEAGSSW